ncbi:MAG: hypothetical protein ACREUG_02980, partial [Steroidobacteraceae bacterium]
MVGQSATSRPNTLYMYVPDVDAAYQRAMSAPGVAKSLRAPTDEWYGDRSASAAGADDARGSSGEPVGPVGHEVRDVGR